MGKCILCGSNRFEDLYDNLERCTNCFLVRTKKKSGVNYKAYHRDRVYREYESYFKNIYMKRFKLVSRYVKSPGRVLEIGSSVGILLGIFKDKGWEAWGVEPSGSIKYSKKRAHKLLKSTFEKCRLPESYFDVVVLNHTLEHMENPRETLKKVNRILKRGGIVFIDVPNFGSLSSRISGEYWKYLLTNEHTYHFTKSTLTKILRKCNFEIIYSRSWSGIFDSDSVVKRFWFNFSKFKLNFFVDIFDVLGNIVSTILNRGTNLVIIGKKK